MKMKRNEAYSAIIEITKKYNWDNNETYKLDQVLKQFGESEFDSAKSIGDIQIINELQELTKRATIIRFNHDVEDGFFVDMVDGYGDFYKVLDLISETKRETLREAMIAAIEYLKK